MPGAVGSLRQPIADIDAMASRIDRKSTAGDRAQHGRAEQHRLLRSRQRDGQAGGIRHDLPDQRTARRRRRSITIRSAVDRRAI